MVEHSPPLTTIDSHTPIVENKIMAPNGRLTSNALRVMALLYHAGPPQYGLTIGRSLSMGNGTLYPILDKLEDAKLIQGEWEDIDPKQAGRRPRRYYTLTGEGVRAFEQERARVFQPGSEVSHAQK